MRGVPPDHGVGIKDLICAIRCGKCSCQFCLEPIKRIAIDALHVAADQISGTFADIFISSSIADIRRNEVAQGAGDSYIESKSLFIFVDASSWWSAVWWREIGAGPA